MRIKNYLLLATITAVIFWVGCGTSTPSVTGDQSGQTVASQKLSAVAPEEMDIQNDVFLLINEYEDSEEVSSEAPRRVDFRESDYFYALSPKNSSYVEDEQARVTYDFIFQRLTHDEATGEPIVVSDRSGQITYKYEWDIEDNTWVMAESSKKDRNPDISFVKNNARVIVKVKAQIMNVPLTNAIMHVASPTVSAIPYRANNKGVITGWVFVEAEDTFEVMISCDGFESYSATIALDNARKRFGRLGTVLLTPDTNAGDHGRLVGQVRDNTGKPIPNATIYLRLDDNLDDTTGIVAATGSVKTDQNGRYEMENIEKDRTFYVVCHADDKPPVAKPFNISGDSTTVDFANMGLDNDGFTVDFPISQVTTGNARADWTEYAYGVVDKYVIYLDGEYKGETNSSTTDFVVTGLIQDTTHLVKVQARDASDAVLGETFGFVSPKAPKADWTVMIYMMGDNNLSVYGTGNRNFMGDINELETLGISGDVNFFVEIDTKGRKGSKRYKIAQDADTTTITSPVIAEMSEINSVDGSHVKNFFKWCIQRYEADHYAIVFWDHGSGWKGEGSGSGAPRRAIGEDRTAKGELISNVATGEMMEELKTIAGQNIDILGYQACLMQMAEVAYEVKDSVDYHLASQENMYGTALQHDQIWTDLCLSPSGTTAQNICDDWISVLDGSVRTLSSIKSTGWTSILPNINALSNALMTGMNEFYNHYFKAWKKTQRFGGDITIRDLKDFCEKLISHNGVDPNIPDDSGNGTAIRNYAQTLIDTIDSGVFVSGNGVYSSSYDNANGISIYMPNPKSAEFYRYYDHYQDQAFAQDTMWDTFLKEWHNKYHPDGNRYHIP